MRNARGSSLHCVLGAIILAITPATPNQLLETAKAQVQVPDKIMTLKRILQEHPESPTARVAREHLVALLSGVNRFDEALQEYRHLNAAPGSGDTIDFKLLEQMLQTGRFAELLRATAAIGGPKRDFFRDLRLLELRVQAFLATGQYRWARQESQQWLEKYGEDVEPDTRYAIDADHIRRLARNLVRLERRQGASGKPMFLSMVPDSQRVWSRRHEVPIVFIKLIPPHSGGQPASGLLSGRMEEQDHFDARVRELNQGLDYLSAGRCSLDLKGLHTLYVKPGDIDPTLSGGHLLSSRVYAQTLPAVRRWAGDAFVILVDYRASSAGEAAFMGDGVIHIAADQLGTLVLLHEILHGLGATHQNWASLKQMGHRFDPDDRGLMTFENGEIVYLGLEEKNRALLGWPRVSVVKLNPEAPLNLSALPVTRDYAALP